MSEKDTKIDILDEIKKRRDEAQSFWSDNYERGIEDKEFVTKKVHSGKKAQLRNVKPRASQV